MSKQDQPEHKGKANNNFTLADWNTIPEQLIYEAVTKEGKPIIAKTLGINIDIFRDWFKFRKVNIPVVRNANYYNARKPLEEQGPWEDELSKQILVLMEEARSKRLKEYKEENEHIEVICPTCGKAFETSKKNPQKYCSASCVSNRIRSDEEKAKLSESCTGREAWNKGRKCTAEEKQKMSEASKKFWAEKGFKEKMSEIQKEIWKDEQLRNTMSDKCKEHCTSEWREKQSAIIKEAFANNPEYIKKISAACQEKYGVPYNCMTKQCQKAGSVISQVNQWWKHFLNVNDNDLEYCISGYSYDLKLNDTVIDINPTFTHTTETMPRNYGHKSTTYHMQKSIAAEQAGFRCIHIWDWDDPNKVKMLFMNTNILYARKLALKEINNEDANNFLNTYHLQNTCNGQLVRLGLYQNDELIQVMTFGKPRYNKKYDWELLRLCTKADYKVIGGSEKLFKYFITNYNPQNIISYCDRNKFTGRVYIKLGFNLLSRGKPSKHWYNIKTKKHITNNLLLMRGYSQLHNDNTYVKGENNEKLMLDNGYLPIYDAGQATYTWHSDNSNSDVLFQEKLIIEQRKLKKEEYRKKYRESHKEELAEKRRNKYKFDEEARLRKVEACRKWREKQKSKIVS